MYLLFKDSLIKIKKTIGRFFSLLIIVGLGIGFFAGIRYASVFMLNTADVYYDEYNLMDYKIVSTYGFTDEDVEAMKKIKNVDRVIPTYSSDVISNGIVIRVNSIESNINQVTLLNGRMPKAPNECLAENAFYKIGDKIEIETNDILKQKEFVVVGTINSVMFIGLDKGVTPVGNGDLENFIYIPKTTFESERYTEVYLTAIGSKKEQSYSKDYENIVAKLEKNVNNQKELLITKQYEETYEKLSNTIIEQKDRINNEIAKVEKELLNNKKELDKNNNTINKALQEIAKNQSSLETITNEKKEQIKKGFIEVEKGFEEYNNKESYYNDNKSLWMQQLQELSILINNENDLSKKEMYQQQYDELETTINNTPKELINIKLSLQNTQKELDNSLIVLNETYEKNIQELNKKKNELTYSQDKIKNGYSAYEKGKKQLNNKKIDADNEIKKAEQELHELKKPTWYLLSRLDNMGYLDYKEDALKVEAIAKVFPVFFILVAALVCLNTMKRMVEEERGEIGTLKSLGFKNRIIIIPYIIYVIIASVIGGSLGLLLGYNILPRVIFNIYSYAYYMRDLIISINIVNSVLFVIIAMIVILTVTLLTLYKTLKETPANLNRPKAPPIGKKVLLERINSIWSKLSFIWKVTVRNLFRYKQRIFMTIIGIAGCTALLLTGFGLRDGIINIIDYQFNKIFNQDTLIILKENKLELSDELNNLFNDNNVKNPLLVKQESFSFKAKNKKHDFYLVVPQNQKNIEEYVNFINKKDQTKTSMTDDGVIITEKMAQLLNAKKGQSIKIRDVNNELHIVKVNDIVENYVYHYMYMTKDYYQKVFNQECSFNMLMASTKNENRNSVSTNLLKNKEIENIKYVENDLERFDTMVDGLNKIVFVIILAACILAFVVLYNLTTINITERIREIATLKVLGFKDKEVSYYVYRESICLTIIGIVLGIIMGIFLERYVIITSELDYIRFSQDISLLSFILSILITLIFSIIVQLVANKKLKKIDMIESLKSIE